MIGMGGGEILIILALLGGGGSLDIVGTLPAKDYFKARDIEVSAERLMELAATTPDSSKKQIGQLMALSHLANDIELLKKSAKIADHRKTLKEIAEGKKASDPSGFAASYAQKVVAALDGQKLPPSAKSTWKETIKHLPESTSLVGVADLTANASADRKLPDVGVLFKEMDKDDKERFWSGVEKIGNVQFDSLGFALVNDATGKPKELVMRFTGKGNPDSFAALFDGYKEDKSKERTGPKGEKVRMFVNDRDGPAIAIVGAEEILVGGYPPEFNRGADKKKHEEVIDRLLVERAKKGDGPLQGLLKTDLAKVPADAGGLVVGFWPKEGGGGIPMPVKILAHAKRSTAGIDVKAVGAMGTEEDAKGFIDMIGKTRDQGLQELTKLQGQPIPAMPGVNVGTLIGMLESVQLQVMGNDAQIRVLLPDDSLVMAATAMIMPMRLMRVQQAAPKVIEKKRDVEKK